MQRLYGGNRRDAGNGALGQKIPGRTRIRAARVRIADRRRKEFNKARTGPLTGRGHKQRNSRRCHGSGPKSCSSTASSDASGVNALRGTTR